MKTEMMSLQICQHYLNEAERLRYDRRMEVMKEIVYDTSVSGDFSLLIEGPPSLYPMEMLPTNNNFCYSCNCIIESCEPNY